MSSAPRCSQAAYADCRVKAPCFRKCQDKAKVLKNQHAAESAVEALQRKMQAQQEDMERKIIRLKSLRNIQDDHRVLDSHRTFVPPFRENKAGDLPHHLSHPCASDNCASGV